MIHASGPQAGAGGDNWPGEVEKEERRRRCVKGDRKCGRKRGKTQMLKPDEEGVGMGTAQAKAEGQK